MRIGRIAGQVVAYAAFGALIGWLSADPVWRHTDPEAAQLKLSFRHAGARAGDCRRLTPEEIAALPPNMRRPMDCPRGRLPVLVEIEVDGTLLLSELLEPTGIARDGASSVYRRFPLEPGEHRVVARLRDSNRAEGFDYEDETTVELAARQNFVVDFQSSLGGFQFR